MITLGVDPDTFNTGIAVVDFSRLGPQVLYATSVRVDPKRGVDWRIDMQIKGICEVFRGIHSGEWGPLPIGRVAVETMRHYTGKTKVRPQDLIHLNAISGGALGAARAWWPTASAWAPKPSAWKGTMPNEVCERRTLKAVGLTPVLTAVAGVEDLTQTQRGHVIAGIGLALKVATHHFPGSLR